MRLSKEKSSEILGAVRKEMVGQPDITIFELQEKLSEEYKHLFDKNYIAKLKNKIHKERSLRYNHIAVEYELAKLEDEIKELKKLLWEIVENPASSNREKISAMREIRTMGVTLLEALFNAGIFERQLGKLETESKLTTEQEGVIGMAIEYVDFRGHGIDKTAPKHDDINKKE